MNDALEAELARLAEAITDETAVDWESLRASGVLSAAGLERLRTLEAIARAHREASSRTETHGPDSVLFSWGPLRVVEKLGEGGFGEVYRAWDPTLRREVALKLRRLEAGGRDASSRRWMDEARRLARVRHPGVLVVHGADVHEGRAGIWTELLRGSTLEAWLAERGPLGAEEAAPIGVDLCRALGAVHDAGLVHGDVKTSNVMRESSGRLVLMDFGSALDSSSDSTSSSLGTPLAMAPEVLAGAAPSRASDLYSLGVLLYRLASGRYPVEATDLGELRERLAAHGAVPLDAACPGLTPAFVAVVDRALDAEATRRWSSAEELERALADLIAPGPPPLPGPRGLPVPLTSFVGRELEVAEGLRLLDRHRLLTFTGAGGCGKTRLALRVAESALESGWHGMWFVGLASLCDPLHVPSTVAAALGVRERGDVPAVQGLIERLHGHRALIVLDNCEHVLATAAVLVRELMEHCAGLHLIATSREPLGIPGEHRIVVPPMTVPDPAEADDVAAAGRHESVRLFVERAADEVAGFALEPNNVQAVAEICRRVDGIPLAVELAAARVRVLGPAEIAERLDRQLVLLQSDAAGGEPRHRTLRSTVLWSVDLLTDDQRRAFRELAVFAGGCDLEAASVVLGVPSDLDALEPIGVLVNRSLLVAERSGAGPTRYRYLEPIRQCALELLSASGAGDAARDRHLRYVQALAERAQPHLEGPLQRRWLDRLEREHQNLLAALEWCAQSPGRAEIAQDLAASLMRFWNVHGHAGLGVATLERVLNVPGAEQPTLARARALLAAGLLRVTSNVGQKQVSAYFADALALFRAQGDRNGTARCLRALAIAAGSRGDHEAAGAWLDEAEAIYREIGDRPGLAAAAHNRGLGLWDLGDLAAARERFETAANVLREIGDLHTLLHATVALTFIAVRVGDHRAAHDHAIEGLTLTRDLRARSASAAGLLLAAAELAAGLGRHLLAARLFGAADAALGELGLVLTKAEHWWEDHDRCAAAIRAALGDEACDRSWEEGRALSCERAAEMALADLGATA